MQLGKMVAAVPALLAVLFFKAPVCRAEVSPLETTCVELSSRIISEFAAHISSTAGQALVIERFEVFGAGDFNAVAARVGQCLAESFADRGAFTLYESTVCKKPGEIGSGESKASGEIPLYRLRGHIDMTDFGLSMAGRLVDASRGKVLLSVHTAAPRPRSGSERSTLRARKDADVGKGRPWEIALLVGIGLRNRLRDSGFHAGAAVRDPSGKYEFGFDHTRFSTKRSVHVRNEFNFDSKTRFDYTVHVREYRLLAARLLRHRKAARNDVRKVSLDWNLRFGGGIVFTQAARQFLGAQGLKLANPGLDDSHRNSPKLYMTSGMLLGGMEATANDSLGLQMTASWALPRADTSGLDVIRGGIGLTARAAYYFDIPDSR